jgi:REP element-mobilizing transposase RayT
MTYRHAIRACAADIFKWPAPPHLAPAKLVQYIKGRSSRKLQEEFPELRKRYWG